MPSKSVRSFKASGKTTTDSFNQPGPSTYREQGSSQGVAPFQTTINKAASTGVSTGGGLCDIDEEAMNCCNMIAKVKKGRSV